MYIDQNHRRACIAAHKPLSTYLIGDICTLVSFIVRPRVSMGIAVPERNMSLCMLLPFLANRRNSNLICVQVLYRCAIPRSLAERCNGLCEMDFNVAKLDHCMRC